MVNLLLPNQGENRKRISIQVFPVHIDGGDPAVFIGRIVIDPACGVAAGGIDGDFRFALYQHAAAHVGNT